MDLSQRTLKCDCGHNLVHGESAVARGWSLVPARRLGLDSRREVSIDPQRRVHLVQTLHPPTGPLRLDGHLQCVLCDWSRSGLGAYPAPARRGPASAASRFDRLWLAMPASRARAAGIALEATRADSTEAAREESPKPNSFAG